MEYIKETDICKKCESLAERLDANDSIPSRAVSIVASRRVEDGGVPGSDEI